MLSIAVAEFEMQGQTWDGLWLQSEHRTFDPEEADYFYVPIYTSCLMWPIYGWGGPPLVVGRCRSAPQTLQRIIP